MYIRQVFTFQGLCEYRATGEKLMIQPALPETAGVLSFDEAVACMDAGYAEMMKLTPVIREIFNTER